SEVFELHDRAQVEVFAYYCGVPSSDAVNARIKGAVEHWVDISGLTDDQAAARIAADGVDILVDVNGHTRSARTGVFARRPAPIQVNWLGYPGTMGSPYHQFMVADDWIVPPEFELYYSEKVLRLPCYQPNDRKRIVAAQRPTRAEAGLPDDALVFCCFNASHKITLFTFDRWMEILTRVEGSVLWLLASGEDTHARLLAHAERAGVAAERIIFAPKMQNALHLARYPLADLSLDSVPYGAHTTASDALWMGVPVLTLSGRSFASRVCGSLVRAAGLAELACVDPQDFVERAVALGSDRTAIAALKARLEANRGSCDLFNMEKLVASLEGLYRRMAEDHRLGALPRPDLSNLGDYLEVGTGLDHEGREMLARADYHDAYRQGLARRHDIRPIRSDRRVWTEADIAQADLGLAVALVETPRPLAAPAASEDPFDVAMTALIARNPKAFFVQVGGFDGVSFDPLRPHVVAGNLSGVIAEPIPQYFEKLQALYAGSSRVTPVNCAISDADGERTIWKFNPEAVERGLLPPHFAGISSFLMEDLLKETGVLGRSSPNAETTEALRTLVQPVSVPCLTLETLLTQRGVDQVDILQIDTEGYDYEILKLFDFNRFRPSVVHYEHQHLNAEDTAAAEALLRSHGYRVSRQTFDTTAVMDAPAVSLEADGLRALALGLGAEGRAADALLLLEHLNALRPSDPETLRGLVRALGQEGRTLEALAKLSALKLALGDPEAVI
ncbi:MAG TPA: FkbM family methyltransferase, partial [Phenylobacterium sp.]|nr:FkbM family methyltransferase [Phenylobacterium sp.]